MGISFISSIPTLAGIIGFKDHLSPSVIDPESHGGDAKTSYADGGVLSKTSGRKSIGHVQQGIDDGLHRQTGGIGTFKLVKSDQTGLEGAGGLVLMDYRIQGSFCSGISISKDPLEVGGAGGVIGKNGWFIGFRRNGGITESGMGLITDDDGGLGGIDDITGTGVNSDQFNGIGTGIGIQVGGIGGGGGGTIPKIPEEQLTGQGGIVKNSIIGCTTGSRGNELSRGETRRVSSTSSG